MEAISAWLLPQALALVTPDIPGESQPVMCSPNRVQIIQVVMGPPPDGGRAPSPCRLLLSDKSHTVQASLGPRCGAALRSGARLKGAVAQLKQFYWTVVPPQQQQQQQQQQPPRRCRCSCCASSICR